MLRLQGFPDNFEINVSYTQLKKIAGNSVSVPVIRLIAEQMLISMMNKTPFEKPEKQLELIDDFN